MSVNDAKLLIDADKKETRSIIKKSTIDRTRSLPRIPSKGSILNTKVLNSTKTRKEKPKNLKVTPTMAELAPASPTRKKKA